jgi:hypothetical protein
MRERNKQDNSVIDWRTLRARKAYLGLYNEDMARAAGCSMPTVTAFLAGDEEMKPGKIISLAAALGLRVKVTFEVIEDDMTGENINGTTRRIQ